MAAQNISKLSTENMVAEDYYLDRGYLVKTKQNIFELIAVGVLIIAVIVAVVLSIIILVKVNDSCKSNIHIKT